MSSAMEEWARRQIRYEDHRHEMTMREMRESNERIECFCIRHRWLGRLWWGPRISSRARANLDATVQERRLRA